MALGPAIRGLFGPWERQIANAYRAIYVDLDDWAAKLQTWVSSPGRILEVGCGEGAFTERLAALYPQSDILAIDITPRVGRLFRGSSDRVQFRAASVEDVARESPGSFDLVLLGDVLHHVPPAMRRSLLEAIREATAPGGTFVFKEWVRTAAPIHWLCAGSDRYLTGDRVSYLSTAEALRLLVDVFGDGAVEAECRVRPWRNNVAFLVARA